MARRAGPALALSLVAHAGLLIGLLAIARAAVPPEPVPAARSMAPAVLAKVAAARAAAGRDRFLAAARASLVKAAREARAAGRLELGRFLLEASRIDAEEAGIELDLGKARERYAERVAAMRAALAKKTGGGVAAAAAAVFADLRYHGKPGGLMASAVVDGAGSCEQVSQLVVATVHDAGRPAEIALRYYGGAMEDGVAHITPIALEGADERDLMTGAAAHPGGVRIAADALVEVYAAAHGLAPKPRDALSEPPDVRGSPPKKTDEARHAGSAGTERRPTLLAGLPPNGDRYPGALPLYAARAIRDPARDPPLSGEGESIYLEAQHCAYFLRIAMLTPPSIEVVTDGTAAAFSVEPRRVPVPLKLEREAVLLRAAETVARRPGTDPIDRVMAWACLALLGETAAIDFALAREHALSRDAAAARERGLREGKAALDAIAWAGDEGARAARKLSAEYGGKSWILLALEGGDRVVMDLVTRGEREDWGRFSALGALVVWPGTRARAVGLVAEMSLGDQVVVMHEVFHAHDHMRPWASTFELDGTAAESAGAAQFLTAYRVFRGLAWRLWEAQHPVAETLAALRAEARELGLDRAWEGALLEYYAVNALGLLSQRLNGIEAVPLFRSAAALNPHPSLDPLRRRLAYLAEQHALDARAVADAMRLP